MDFSRSQVPVCVRAQVSCCFRLSSWPVRNAVGHAAHRRNLFEVYMFNRANYSSKSWHSVRRRPCLLGRMQQTARVQVLAGSCHHNKPSSNSRKYNCKRTYMAVTHVAAAKSGGMGWIVKVGRVWVLTREYDRCITYNWVPSPC